MTIKAAGSKGSVVPVVGAHIEHGCQQRMHWDVHLKNAVCMSCVHVEGHSKKTKAAYRLLSLSLAAVS